MSTIPIIEVGTGNQSKVITPALLTAIGPNGQPVAVKADADGQILTSGSGSSAAPTEATETAAGIVELATTIEAAAGTDTTRAVTAAGVAAYVTANPPSVSAATATSSGIVELATLAEAQAGTDTTRVVTPANLPFVTTASGVVWRSTIPSTASSVFISNANTNLTSPNTIGIGTNITKYSWSGDNIVIGNGSAVNNNGAISIGFATSSGSNSLSIGNGATTAGGSVSVGRNANSSSDNTVVVGSNSYTGSTATKAIAIGNTVSVNNGSTLSTGIGANVIITAANSIALGAYSKNTAASTGELGIWNAATGGSLRASAVRIHGKTDNTDGYVAFTAAKVASPGTMTAGASGVATEGTEAHGTLMPSGLTFRVNTSNQLVAVYNDAGTIRTLVLGTLT